MLEDDMILDDTACLNEEINEYKEEERCTSPCYIPVILSTQHPHHNLEGLSDAGAPNDLMGGV